MIGWLRSPLCLQNFFELKKETVCFIVGNRVIGILSCGYVTLYFLCLAFWFLIVVWNVASLFSSSLALSTQLSPWEIFDLGLNCYF